MELRSRYFLPSCVEGILNADIRGFHAPVPICSVPHIGWLRYALQRYCLAAPARGIIRIQRASFSLVFPAQGKYLPLFWRALRIFLCVGVAETQTLDGFLATIDIGQVALRSLGSIEKEATRRL